MVEALERRFAELQSYRTDHEAMWRLISQYILPRRNFNIEGRAGALRQRRLVDNTGVTSCERMAAVMHGHLINPFLPWQSMRLEEREPDETERRWLDDVVRRQFRFLSGAASSYRAHAHEFMLDQCAFSNGIMWRAPRQQGQLPFYKTLPLIENYWDEDEAGRINTNYRRFRLTLRQALERYPYAPGLKERLRKNKDNQAEVLEFIHAVEPREGGERGAINERKPWSSIVWCKTNNEICSVSGYDRFPYSIARMQKRTGERYGIGPGWSALPMCILLNEMRESVIRAAELANDPPLLDVTGQIAGLDRRPAAMNVLANADMALMQDPQKMLVELHKGGMAELSIDQIRDVQMMIRETFYVDWLSLGSGQYVTAEFVADKRDLRLRSMSPIVSGMEMEHVADVGDATFEFLQAADFFAPPPQSLDGEDIVSEYTSPLAIAQKSNEAEMALRALETIGGAAQLDEEVLDDYDIAAITWHALENRGAPATFRNSDDVKQAKIAQRRERQEQAMQAQQAEQMARAGRDGAQGLATLEGAGAAA